MIEETEEAEVTEALKEAVTEETTEVETEAETEIDLTPVDSILVSIVVSQLLVLKTVADRVRCICR